MLMGMAFALSYSLYPLHAQSAPATAAAAAATLTTSAAPAVAPSEAPSRIASVKLYPGSATIERVTRLAAGSRSYTFRCLPAALDAASVQTRADAAVRIGETRIEVQERDIAGGCTSALEERWHTKETQNYMPDYEYDSVAKRLYQLQLVQRETPFKSGSAISSIIIKKVD